MGNHNSSTHSSGHSANICDISDYLEVFQMIKQLQTDIYADTMYPNAKRPDVNPGYQTKYGNNS